MNRPQIYNLNHAIRLRQQYLIWSRVARTASWESWSAFLELY